MLNFELYIPTKLYFGRGQCGRVGEIAAGRGFRRALICYGGGSAVRSGLLERIKTSLDAAWVEYDEFGGIQANPTAECCARMAGFARDAGAPAACRGGGSVIDTAKMAAHCVRTGRDPETTPNTAPSPRACP
ncbi:MAG: iron-containing alcohol dehydrogenase [Oscillospiraceae bacterium]